MCIQSLFGLANQFLGLCILSQRANGRILLGEESSDEGMDDIIIMSKYKYEKEFMFSNKRLDEVELFLQNQQNPLDLLAIRDNNKNTVIHHTAYHNQTKVLELYLKYYRKNLENEHRSLVEIKFQTRYLLDQPNSEGYTAVHYAVFRGNISVLKILEKYQANFSLTNHLKMGVLHLAAQGDKLCSFLYMHSKKLDINIRDSKMSTPLHWAAFAGGEKVVQYLLAQKDIDLNPVDVEGFTPLHLATTYGNSKIVKKLLIAGADRQPRTNKDQTALQIAQQKQFHGIKRMLDVNYTLKDRLKLLCNAKIKYKPQSKSFLPIIVFLLVSAVAALMSFWILEFKELWTEIVQICVYVLALVLYLSLAFKGKKGEIKPQNYALYAQNRRLYNLCLICVKEMSFRQRHCHICKSCVPQYDHHCTWINNCVGKYNLFRFNLFLYATFISLTWCGFLSARIVVCLLSSQYDTLLFTVRPWFQQEGKPIVLVVAVIIFLVFLVFGLPLLFLILVQAKNLLLGKTTYERFSKAQQSLLTREGSFLNLDKHRVEPSTASLGNCLNMYYEYESQNKQDREFSNSTSSSANRIVQ